MNFLKYLVGGILFVILQIVVSVAQGGTFTISQSNLMPMAITTLLALVAFAIADQLVKSR